MVSRDVINIPDAYESPHFNPDVDRKSGYRTKSVLAVPVTNDSGDVIGAVQVINKQNGDNFDDEDIAVLSSFAVILLSQYNLASKVKVTNHNLEAQLVSFKCCNSSLTMLSNVKEMCPMTWTNNALCCS